jgi:hypothetical protein
MNGLIFCGAFRRAAGAHRHYTFHSRSSPGLGQHYCVECAKHFESDEALKSHWKSKVHKRRCRALREPAYTQEEADRAAGLGREEKQPIP